MIQKNTGIFSVYLCKIRETQRCTRRERKYSPLPIYVRDGEREITFRNGTGRKRYFRPALSRSRREIPPCAKPWFFLHFFFLILRQNWRSAIVDNWLTGIRIVHWRVKGEKLIPCNVILTKHGWISRQVYFEVVVVDTIYTEHYAAFPRSILLILSNAQCLRGVDTVHNKQYDIFR